MVKLDGFFNEITQLGEDGFLIISVAAAVKQSWATPDIALTFVGPLDNLDIPSTVTHDFDSLMTCFTSRSW